MAGNPELRAFQVGVDIKELAADPTNESLIGVNRGCYETFAAVYDCEVPVIAAIHGYCLGGGVGIAGNADIVVAADDLRARASRGRPRRARCGDPSLAPRARQEDALDVPHGLDGRRRGAARVRDASSGSCPRGELLDAAREIAHVIAAKSPLVIRRAKESLNAIDPVDVKRSYRFEQGFTFELNLWGDSDELRQAFVDKREADV